MRITVRKRMRLLCLLFAMVLLAGVPAAAKDKKESKAKSSVRNCCEKKKWSARQTEPFTSGKNDSWRIKKENDSYQKRI